MIKHLHLFSAMLLIALPSFCFAQWNENGAGMFQSQEEYHAFMGAAKQAAANSPELEALIPMINDVALGQAIGSTAKQYNIASSPTGLLSDPKVREDIEMVDSQYEELKDLTASVQQRLASQLKELDFSDTDNIAGRIQELRNAAEKDVNAVLLPHQLTRLRQIAMRSQLRRRSLVQILTSDPFKADLEITDDQADELVAAEKEIQAELRREIAKLQEKARNKLISSLKPTQEKQVKELIGDAFEFTTPEKDSFRKGKRKAAQGKKGYKKN